MTPCLLPHASRIGDSGTPGQGLPFVTLALFLSRLTPLMLGIQNSSPFMVQFPFFTLWFCGNFQTLVALQKVVRTPSAGPKTHGWEDLLHAVGAGVAGPALWGWAPLSGFVTHLYVLSSWLGLPAGRRYFMCPFVC